MTQIRLGVAQPRTWYGADEKRNLDLRIRSSSANILLPMSFLTRSTIPSNSAEINSPFRSSSLAPKYDSTSS